MEYISVGQFAEKYGVSERTVRNYCASGKIAGVIGDFTNGGKLMAFCLTLVSRLKTITNPF